MDRKDEKVLAPRIYEASHVCRGRFEDPMRELKKSESEGSLGDKKWQFNSASHLRIRQESEIFAIRSDNIPSDSNNLLSDKK